MMKRNRLTSILLALLVLCLFGVAPVFASGDSDSDSDSDNNNDRCRLIGSWQTIVDSNPNNIALFTFGKGKTTTSAISDNNASSGAGAWKRTGPRSFTSSSRAFLFDPSGANPTVIAVLTDEIELSADCKSYTSAFQTDLTLFDGTVVATVTGTSDGTRLTVN